MLSTPRISVSRRSTCDSQVYCCLLCRQRTQSEALKLFMIGGRKHSSQWHSALHLRLLNVLRRLPEDDRRPGSSDPSLQFIRGSPTAVSPGTENNTQTVTSTSVVLVTSVTVLTEVALPSSLETSLPSAQSFPPLVTATAAPPQSNGASNLRVPSLNSWLHMRR